MTLTAPASVKKPDLADRRGAARFAAVQALYQMDIAGAGVKAVITEFETHRLDCAPDSTEEDAQAGYGGQSGDHTKDQSKDHTKDRTSDQIVDRTASPPVDRMFFAEVLEGVVTAQAKIDSLIAQHLAQGWTLSRLDSIARAILRGAIYELMARSDIPAKVVLDEYIEIANAFFDIDTPEPKFINGILDAIAQQGRGDEL